MELPVGSYILWYHEEGSWRYHPPIMNLYKVTKEGTSLVKTWECESTSGWALECRDEIAAIVNQEEEDVNPLRGFTDQELLAEIRRRGLID